MSEPASGIPHNCYIDIVALAGGDESIVFMDMMTSMYSLWAYSHDFPFRKIEVDPDNACLPARHTRLQIEGADPVLLAERENGVHRMIRIPPGQSQRHTAFVGVRVCAMPQPLPAGPEGWGDQIRSVVMAPYQGIKNHRTGFICGDITSVLAGDMEQYWEEIA